MGMYIGVLEVFTGRRAGVWTCVTAFIEGWVSTQEPYGKAGGVRTCVSAFVEGRGCACVCGYTVPTPLWLLQGARSVAQQGASTSIEYMGQYSTGNRPTNRRQMER